jgi:hypothetical protein
MEINNASEVNLQPKTFLFENKIILLNAAERWGDEQYNQ